MDTGWFDGLDDVVHDELRFKAKLGIGDDVYTSVKLKKALFDAWDVAGVAATGAQVASSAMVAQKFFAVPSLLSAIGIGTATAATPIGWVIAASVVSGGAWIGITRYLKSDSGKSKVIPDFINTPIDLLGLSLFDLMAPLAVSVARVDGHIAEQEVNLIRNYFVNHWGYSEAFANRGLQFIQEQSGDFEIKATAAALAAFARDNRDCKAETMLADVSVLLRDVMEADGRIDEREEMAIERIEKVFADELSFSLSRTIGGMADRAKTLIPQLRKREEES